jgi:adenosylhomocysteine nucleosidase
VDTILLVAAEAREFAGIWRHCRSAGKLRSRIRFARTGHLNGNRFVMVANGAGPVLARKALDAAVSKEKVDALVSVGFCGALDPALEAGDIFVASGVYAAERSETFETRLPATAKPYACGHLFSVDRVIRTVEEKRHLRTLGAGAVEMEASAVASYAQQRGIPFFCIRVVVDTANEGLLLDWNAVRDREGRLRVSRVFTAALGRPKLLAPELFKLYHRSRHAARALGDFLVCCRF